MTARFTLQPPLDQVDLPFASYDRWLAPDGEPSVLFHRSERGYLLRFIDLADFAIDLASGQVVCTPVPDVAEETLADLHFNQIVPLILGWRGELVLHASAVSTGAGAIGFLGATGRGKSTLAGALARSGCPFLTDDGLILDPAADGPMVRPRRPILRLRSDSEAALTNVAEVSIDGRDQIKARVAAGVEIPFCDTAVPLAALYVLLPPNGSMTTDIVPLPPSAVLPQLLSHSFILDVEDQARVHRHFDRLAGIARSVRCFTLDYPRSYDALPNVVQAIIDHAQTGVTQT